MESRALGLQCPLWVIVTQLWQPRTLNPWSYTKLHHLGSNTTKRCFQGPKGRVWASAGGWGGGHGQHGPVYLQIQPQRMVPTREEAFVGERHPDGWSRPSLRRSPSRTGPVEEGGGRITWACALTSMADCKDVEKHGILGMCNPPCTPPSCRMYRIMDFKQSSLCLIVMEEVSCKCRGTDACTVLFLWF